jgi:FHS family Na+ dependent glucose MFS transporter 1
VYDRLPGHRVMAAGLVGLALTLALAPVIQLLALLTGMMLALGAAEGLFDVGGNTLLVWVHGEKVGPFMNALHFFFGLGAFISPIIVAQAVLVGGGISVAYWVLAGLVLLPGIALWISPSPAHPQHAAGYTRLPVNVPLVVLLMLFFFLYVGAEVSFGGWIFTYAQAQGLVGKVEAAFLTSGFWGAYTLGRLFSIPIAQRFRPRTVLLVDLLGCVVSVAVMLIWRDSRLAVWAGAIGTGLFMASIFPTGLLLAGRRMTITGFSTSLFFVGSSAGGMVVPFLIGQFFERLGPPVTMGIILASLALDLAVFIWLTVKFSAEKHE